jgi:glycosyltransferase involved in cell wall biosynthesis
MPDGYTIVHVSTETGWRGGEQQVRYLTDGLAARGHRCIVVCPRRSALYADRERAGMARPLEHFGEFDIFAASRLAHLAESEGAHLIHAHTSHAHTLAWLAARKTPVPAVISRRVDFPVGGNWLSRRKYDAPSVHYIAISDAVRGVLLQAGIASSRIAIVHSGVDPSRYAFRGGPRDEAAAAGYGTLPGVPLVVNVAALVDHKDQTTLLRAAAALARDGAAFRLVIAGDGELAAHLKSLAAELGIADRVLFAGYVRDVPALLRAADLFVMSSHLEGLCTSILDAMLAGVPVVATRTGGIPEIVEHGRNGLLAPPRDPGALAAQIRALLGDPDLAAALATEGRATVMRRFTNDSMVDGTLAAYRDILGKYHGALSRAQKGGG